MVPHFVRTMNLARNLPCSPSKEGFPVWQMICALTLGMAGGYAVHSMFAVMGWH
jgi:hypothetical protein